MDKILRHDSLAILSRGPIYLTRSSKFLLSLWTKSYDVTTFMIERLQQYFHVVLFIQYVVGVTIQMELLRQYFRLVLFYEAFGSKSFSLNEILWCDQSKEASLAVLVF